jgi:hypothetical protein
MSRGFCFPEALARGQAQLCSRTLFPVGRIIAPTAPAGLAYERETKKGSEVETKLESMRSGCCNSTHFYNYGEQVLCMNKKCNNYLEGTSVNNKESRSLRYLSFILVFACCILYSPRNYCSGTIFSLPMTQPRSSATPNEPLTMENLEKEIYSLDMVCPEVVLAQVKLESGHLTSNILKRSNNMFGMRYPMKRKTTAIGIYIPSLDSVVIAPREVIKKYAQYSSYAVYAKWQDAIADYKLWQENTFKVNERYIDFLQKNYAEDSLYVQRVKILARKK